MELKETSENVWEIKQEGRMNVPAIIYASKALMDKIKLDRTLLQAANVAQLKGILKAAYVLPDAHEGFQLSLVA
jgi:tRNA-splicing ligase RtcB